ncbi:MAG TPA: acyltransferase family protein, partial [Trebonia sp.]|nr:acyltransferase family protein [Trebonia sp.]
RARKRRAQAAAAGGPPAAGVPPFLGRGNRVVLAVVALVLAAASALLMLKLYHPGYDPTRVYEGTDTRAAGLLIGAALAMVWPTRRLAANGSPAAWRVPAAARWVLDTAGLAGLAVIVLMVWKTNEYSAFMFHGGLVILSVATAATVAAAVTPGSLIGQALGVQPLRWLGVRSYGIYLWHYPIIVLTAAPGTAGTPVSVGRAVAVVAATIIAAALSWRFVEDPIRSGARLRWVAPGRAGRHAETTTSTAGGAAMTGGSGTGGQGTGGGQRPGWLRRPSSPPAIAGVCLLVAAVLAGGVTAGVRLSDDNSHPVASTDNAPPASARLSNTAGQANTAGHAKQAAGGTAAGAAQSGSGAVTVAAAGPAATVAALPTPPPMSSCPEVVHIGDSTSEGLISSDYEPNPANRIPARYADVGIKKSVMKIVGATSIVESLPGTPNAFKMAQQVKRSGFNGCWVLALGTNDTADVAVGSEVGRVQRIQQMMNLIGKTQPVMWVEVVSILKSGPYSEQNMQAWDDALKQVAPQYPNMRIYNW